jgi:ribosomal protein L37AE/L43A
MGMLSRKRKRQKIEDQIAEGVRTSCVTCGNPGHYEDGDGNWLCSQCHKWNWASNPRMEQAEEDVVKDDRSADPDDIVQHPERFYQV